ncbi:DUF3800 domain-containing protein [Hyphobacterium sp. SN044]|uniref:DUF3800 domain-containing protein n=1 Tax=Hyphobacterium sp. SN044 TaxID=2912575 RepID=UPI001F3F82D2|nr:DUF3800 domain-containing protein [Hyphobacterium sp. SN044]MCF8878452.1 DUF3800 domain-containing protein [Hyphobacterium sp. SN044]
MHFTAYIDEAGCDGFSRLATGEPTGQSQWLVLGALIVDHDVDLTLPERRDQIRALFPARRKLDIHYRELKDGQKLAACQALVDIPAEYCFTLSNKATIPGSRFETVFAQKGYLYNYLVRWLLERVTSHCSTLAGNQNASLKVVFSRRSGMNYQAMRDYLLLMRDGREVIRPVRSINWEVLDIDTIAVENHSKWAGLQLADCATSAVFQAFEPDNYGNCHPRCAETLRPRLIRRNKSALNYGMTLVPSATASRLTDTQQRFYEGCL